MALASLLAVSVLTVILLPSDPLRLLVAYKALRHRGIAPGTLADGGGTGVPTTEAAQLGLGVWQPMVVRLKALTALCT